MKTLLKGLCLICALLTVSSLTYAEPYDLVIQGGRVIDPETGLDAIRNIGIVDGTIVSVTKNPIAGSKEINAAGMVVSPGFIDLHSHGQNTVSQTYQVLDGVTTALDLEVGAFPLEGALSSREGKSYINYGYGVGHGYIRIGVKGGDLKKAFHEKPTDAERQKILSLLEAGLDSGGIGIGLPLDYFSLGVDEKELRLIFELAAKRKVPLFVHIRMYDDVRDPTGFQELIDLTRETGASLHMVHITSTALGRTELYLDMLEKARAEGLDITTELYPYTAASTGINSGIFDHNWQKKLGLDYGDIEWPPTGKRFTGKKMWDEYRAKYPDGTVINHAMTEDWVQAAMVHPGVMIASDGMLIESLDQRAHPRGMGTFSRVLGRYVREKGLLTLASAINRMTYLPAKRLESFTPIMMKKGRIQVGADADITVFDPDKIIDTATFAEPNSFSSGISHVIVGGVVVVEDAKLRSGIFPGKPLTTKTQ